MALNARLMLASAIGIGSLVLAGAGVTAMTAVAAPESTKEDAQKAGGEQAAQAKGGDEARETLHDTLHDNGPAAELLRALVGTDGWSAIDTIEMVDPSLVVDEEFIEDGGDGFTSITIEEIEGDEGDVTTVVVRKTVERDSAETAKPADVAVGAGSAPAPTDVARAEQESLIERHQQSRETTSAGGTTQDVAHPMTDLTALLAQGDFASFVRNLQVAMVQISPKAAEPVTMAGQESDSAVFHRASNDQGTDFAFFNGLFVDADGYIVTVVEQQPEADAFEVVTASGDMFDASLVGYDAGTNLAMLKVDGSGSFQHVALSEEAQAILDNLRNGEETAAAPAEPAPKRGYLGVSIQNLSDTRASELGLNDANGIFVSAVRAGSAADEAGLVEGDVILEVNGDEVEDTRDAVRAIGTLAAGAKVSMVVWRDGDHEIVTAVMGSRRSPEMVSEPSGAPIPQARSEAKPEPVAAKPASEMTTVADPVEEHGHGDGAHGGHGTDMAKAAADGAEVHGVKIDGWGLVLGAADERGVLIANVVDGSEAAQKGLKAGDVILRVAESRVEAPEKVRTVVDEAMEAGRPAILLLVRGAAEADQERFVAMKLDGSR